MDHFVVFHGRGGQTLLTLVSLIGGIILVTGTIFVVLSLSLSATAYGARASASAEAVAEGGIEDAMLQLVRNSQFSSTGYTVPLGSSTATVVVTQASPSAGYITVTSLGSVGFNDRQLTAVFSLNASTTQVNLISLQTTQ